MSLSQALNQFAQNLGRYLTDNTPTVYLDANGNVVSKKELSSQQKKLLNDYRLIQYDMTAGKNYLSSTKFFDVK
ncbi:hypothetical protein GBI99_04945 [Bifidobacterium longum]|nr:hypothetical protein GBI99_04945 [Bifidobacterium longum]